MLVTTRPQDMGQPKYEIRDVILTAYAGSAVMGASQAFVDPPLIIPVQGSGRDLLINGRRWAQGPDPYRSALAELAPHYRDIRIRRRAIVCFGEGCALVHSLQRFSKKPLKLDACIVADGLYTDNVSPWIPMAGLASQGRSFLALVHGQDRISKRANMQVWEQGSLIPGITVIRKRKLPRYITHPGMPPEGLMLTVPVVKDRSGLAVLPGQTKVWTQDSLRAWASQGGLYRLEYGGRGRLEQKYLAQQVMPRVWRLLIDFWGAG